MKLTDLRSGMVVQLREDIDKEDLGLIVCTDKNMVIQFTDSFLSLESYKEDLTFNGDSSPLDIVSVSIINDPYQIIRNSLRYADVIWKRSIVKEVTMQEIADKFEVNIEDLKIIK